MLWTWWCNLCFVWTCLSQKKTCVSSNFVVEVFYFWYFRTSNLLFFILWVSELRVWVILYVLVLTALFTHFTSLCQRVMNTCHMFLHVADGESCFAKGAGLADFFMVVLSVVADGFEPRLTYFTLFFCFPLHAHCPYDLLVVSCLEKVKHRWRICTSRHCCWLTCAFSVCLPLDTYCHNLFTWIFAGGISLGFYQLIWLLGFNIILNLIVVCCSSFNFSFNCVEFFFCNRFFIFLWGRLLVLISVIFKLRHMFKGNFWRASWHIWFTKFPVLCRRSFQLVGCWRRLSANNALVARALVCVVAAPWGTRPGWGT